MRTTTRLFSVAAGAAFALCATDAGAHFYLQAPGADNVQDASGNPQKINPCGGGNEPTGVITPVQQGSMLTITLNETIFHPGHYRVALAVNDPSELPDEPPVTPGATECGSAPIMDPPVFPVLADGELVHTSPFSGPQSFEVLIPGDIVCDNCTLQVLEFMSSHGAPCFYHHCARLAIQEEPVMTTSTSASSGVTSGGPASGNGGGGAGGTPSGAGGSTGPNGDTEDEGGCSVAPSRSGQQGLAVFAMSAFVGLGLLARRRRG
jgi:hypothetical protein